MGKVQYQKTSCIHIIHLALTSLTTVTMDTRETGHKARDIPILRGKWTDYNTTQPPPPLILLKSWIYMGNACIYVDEYVRLKNAQNQLLYIIQLFKITIKCYLLNHLYVVD